MDQSKQQMVKKEFIVGLIIGILLTASLAVCFSLCFASNTDYQRVIQEQAQKDADHYATWITNGSNITIVNVSAEEFSNMWEQTIYDSDIVEQCWSAFDFTTFGFQYDSSQSLTIYRCGVSFITEPINGTLYEITFGTVVTW
jgi:hypothetical protein